MALLEDAFKIRTHESRCNQVDPDVIGYAYGPEFKNGLYVYGVHEVKRDVETNKQYIQTRHTKEFVDSSGQVYGNNNKTYRIVYKK